jgi:hypothetical protein
LLELFESIKYNPIAFPTPGVPGSGGFVLDYSTLMNYIVRQMYFPYKWPELAVAINAVLTGDMVALLPVMGGGGSGAAGTAPVFGSRFVPDAARAASSNFTWSPPGNDEALWGIKCSDQHDNSTAEQIAEVLERRLEISHFGGIASDMVSRCAQWPMPAKERYEGDFHVTTKNPVLIIGNTYDPVTPLASARNVSASFEGSVLLQQDSYGVCTRLLMT